MRHIIPISGKDSLATALIQRQLRPDLDYEYVFNPTGMELKEVSEWIDNVEKYLNKPIARVGADLYEIIEGYNFFLPSRLARYCTRESKIEPFEKWIGKEDSTVYYGIRADETRGGYNNAKYPNIAPAYPLKDAGIDINGVYRIINEAGLKPPVFFWESVYQQVLKIVGQAAIDGLTEWQKDLLFAWRSRANCYNCFNQRKYEWAGLYENEPELFWKAEAMEHSESEYYWNGKDSPLTLIVENAESIKSKRVKQVVKMIRQIRDSKTKQVTIWDFDKESEVMNFFNQTSCGLFCGK